jgi:hypothetical protein
VTDAQSAKVAEIAQRFGCGDDYAVRERPFGRPPGWALVTIGRRKGRLRSFCVSPSGEVSA